MEGQDGDHCTRILRGLSWSSPILSFLGGARLLIDVVMSTELLDRGP